MSRTAKFCIFFGGIFALAALVWMVFLPAVVGRELSSITGFDIRVAVLTADPFTGRVLVRGLAANNPQGFPMPDFVQLRELRSRVEVFPSIFSDRIVVDDLDIDVGKIVLMRRKDGKTNAGEFMAAFARRGSGPSQAGGLPRPPSPSATSSRTCAFESTGWSSPTIRGRSPTRGRSTSRSTRAIPT